MLLPNVSIDIAHAMAVGSAMPAYASIPGQWVGNMAVCTGCMHTSFFTLNGPTLLQRVPGATLVKAQGF